MNDTEQFKLWLEERGNCVTLGEILSDRWAAEYRKHFSLLRNPPYNLNFRPKINKKEPSKNLYTLQKEGADVLNENSINSQDSTQFEINRDKPESKPVYPTIFDGSGQALLF